MGFGGWEVERTGTTSFKDGEKGFNISRVEPYRSTAKELRRFVIGHVFGPGVWVASEKYSKKGGAVVASVLWEGRCRTATKDLLRSTYTI
jgi:hypothetical protein